MWPPKKSNYKKTVEYGLRNNNFRLSKPARKKNFFMGQINYANPYRWWIGLREFLDTSFLFAPVCAVVVSAMLAAIVVSLDTWMTDMKINIPSIVATTSTTSQIVLTTTASVTIKLAATAFSSAMVLFQWSSKQYSPRLINTVFRDPVNRKIIAIVIGTLTYAVISLLSVSKPGIDPTITTAIGMFLGVFAVICVLVFIDRVIKTLDISRLLRTASFRAIKGIKKQWAVLNTNENLPVLDEHVHGVKPKCDHLKVKHVVRFRRRGWIQNINTTALAKLIPPGSVLKVHTLEGRFALPGTAAVSVSVEDKETSSNDDKSRDEEAQAYQVISDNDDIAAFDRCILECFAIGGTRSVRFDPTFGLRQTIDVACKAMAPALNDPTTAQDSIFHSASIVIEYLHRRPPVTIISSPEKDGGQLILEVHMTHDAVVRLAYDEIRSYGAGHLYVCQYLIESLAMIRESLRAAGHDKVAPEIERQACLIVEEMDNSGAIDADKETLRAFRLQKFPDAQIFEQELRREDPNKSAM